MRPADVFPAAAAASGAVEVFPAVASGAADVIFFGETA